MAACHSLRYDVRRARINRFLAQGGIFWGYTAGFVFSTHDVIIIALSRTRVEVLIHKLTRGECPHA